MTNGIVGRRVAPVERRGREARVVARAVADDVDTADRRRARHAAANPARGRRRASTVARIAAGPSRISRGTMPSIITPPPPPRRRDRGDSRQRPPRRPALASERTPAMPAAGAASSVTSTSTSSSPNTKPGATCSNLEASARTTTERAIRRSARSDEDLRDGVIHQTLVNADRPDAHHEHVGPQLARRHLGEVAEHRVHPGSYTPPRTISSMPSRSSRTFATSRALVITVRRRSAISWANARAVLPLPIAIVASSLTSAAALRGRWPAWRPWRGSTRVAGREAVRQGGAAVGADDAALPREVLQVPADRGWGHAKRSSQRADALAPSARSARPGVRGAPTSRMRASSIVVRVMSSHRAHFAHDEPSVCADIAPHGWRA